MDIFISKRKAKHLNLTLLEDVNLHSKAIALLPGNVYPPSTSSKKQEVLALTPKGLVIFLQEKGLPLEQIYVMFPKLKDERNLDDILTFIEKRANRQEKIIMVGLSDEQRQIEIENTNIIKRLKEIHGVRISFEDFVQLSMSKPIVKNKPKRKR